MVHLIKLSTTTTRGHPYKLFKRQCVCTVRSSFFIRNGLLIFGIVCLVTLLIFLHSLYVSALLNVSTSVISSTLHSFLRTDIVSLMFLLFFSFFVFYFHFYFFSGRLLVLFFSLVTLAISY